MRTRSNPLRIRPPEWACPDDGVGARSARQHDGDQPSGDGNSPRHRRIFGTEAVRRRHPGYQSMGCSAATHGHGRFNAWSKMELIRGVENIWRDFR
jgi:hypothetical protein